MRSQEIRLDVPDEVDVNGTATLALTVHCPDDPVAPSIVAVGLPGGGYNRQYYDLRIDETDSYSEAAFHTARGWVFIGCDTVGIGESSRVPEGFTIFDVARVQAQAVREIRRRVADGTLAAGLLPAPDATFIGLGQSMGGCFTLATQGDYQSYDAIGVLGYSATHTVVPQPTGLGVDVSDIDDRDRVAQERVAGAMVDAMRWSFHWEDVPSAIVAADLADFPFRNGEDTPAWGVNAQPLACGIDMLTPGIVGAQAAAITCPVLIAQGSRDVVPRPRDEPSAYLASPDITVFIAPTMAHMHNFASTREVFWRRIHSWGEAVRAELAAGL